MTSVVAISLARDGWDWLALWSTVAAAAVGIVAIVIALIAYHRTLVVAQGANDALAGERRHVFELGLLARLLEVCGSDGGGKLEIAEGLLLMLPATDLPSIRQKIEARIVPSNELLREYLGEFQNAVTSKLASPSTTGPVRPSKRSGWHLGKRTLAAWRAFWDWSG